MIHLARRSNQGCNININLLLLSHNISLLSHNISHLSHTFHLSHHFHLFQDSSLTHSFHLNQRITGTLHLSLLSSLRHSTRGILDALTTLKIVLETVAGLRAIAENQDKEKSDTV